MRRPLTLDELNALDQSAREYYAFGDVSRAGVKRQAAFKGPRYAPGSILSQQQQADMARIAHKMAQEAKYRLPPVKANDPRAYGNKRAAELLSMRNRYSRGGFSGLNVDGSQPIPMAAFEHMPAQVAARNAGMAGVTPMSMTRYDDMMGMGSWLKKTVHKATHAVSSVAKTVKKAASNPILQKAAAIVAPIAVLPALINSGFRKQTTPIYAAYAAVGAGAVGAAAIGAGSAGIIGAAAPAAVTGAADTAAGAIAAGGGGDPSGDFADPSVADQEAQGAPTDATVDATPEAAAAATASSPIKPLLGVGAVLAALALLK